MSMPRRLKAKRARIAYMAAVDIMIPELGVGIGLVFGVCDGFDGFQGNDAGMTDYR